MSNIPKPHSKYPDDFGGTEFYLWAIWAARPVLKISAILLRYAAFEIFLKILMGKKIEISVHCTLQRLHLKVD